MEEHVKMEFVEDGTTGEKKDSDPEKDVCKNVSIEEQAAKEEKASDSWEASQRILVEQVMEKTQPQKTRKEDPVKIIEVTKGRESLEELVKKEEGQGEVCLEENPSCIFNGVTEEVALEVKKAEVKSEQRTEKDELKMDFMCKEIIVEADYASTEMGVSSENEIEKAKRDTEVINPVEDKENKRDEGETEELGTSKVPKDSEKKEELNLGEAIKEREVDAVKPKEKIIAYEEDKKTGAVKPEENIPAYAEGPKTDAVKPAENITAYAEDTKTDAVKPQENIIAVAEDTKTDAVKPEENVNAVAEGTKYSPDERNEEAVAQPVQKQSNNVISKMKQSMRKAKKAIIRKCPCKILI